MKVAHVDRDHQVRVVAYLAEYVNPIQYMPPPIQDTLDLHNTLVSLCTHHCGSRRGCCVRETHCSVHVQQRLIKTVKMHRHLDALLSCGKETA